jgi:hypothetical protein
MEMRAANIIKYSRLITCVALLFCFTPKLKAQTKNYAVKDGKMCITLDKRMQKNALDSFIDRYNLYDLNLPHFMNTGSPDSLSKLGWQVDVNNSYVFVISKKLFSADNVSDPADKIIFSQNDGADNQFPNSVDQTHFGYNHFKNKLPFSVTDSVVCFYLRGNMNAGKVILTGSFFNWNPLGVNMTKTDSGWVYFLKLPPGKHLYKFIIDGRWSIDKDNLNTENDGRGNDNSVYYKTNFIFKLAGYTSAKKVYLSGSFNGWQKKELLMQSNDNGWMIPVYLSEGTHTYRFIADGNWFEDPANADKLPNEFNAYNSVIRIGKPYIFKLSGFTDAKKVMLLGSFNNWREGELYMTKTTTGWELPYVLGSGNYEYRFVIDGKNSEVQDGIKNIALVIDTNYTFRLKGFAYAKKVFLAGDFNNWSPNSFAMKRQGDEWVVSTHLSKGKQRYKFVVDDEWMLDPANKLWEQNEHNSGNSVLWFEQDF